jgi:hypothetical protein
MGGHDGETERAGGGMHLHAVIAAQLYEYAAAQALGVRPETRFPHIAAHLSNCPACQATFDELLGLVAPTYSGSVPLVARRPRWRVPESGVVPSPEPWSVDRFGRLLVQFSAALLESLSQPAVAAVRGPGRYHYEVQSGLVPPVRLTIEIVPDEADPALGHVEVQVDVGTRGPLDQAGTRVVLRAGDRVWAAETDSTGYAIFPGIPGAALPGLRIEVAPVTEGAE